MLRSVCSLSLTAFAFAHGFRGGEVIGRDMGKLRRIFIFIFYSVLILHKEERKKYIIFYSLYILRQEGGRGRYISGHFFSLYILSQGRGKGDTLVQNFF